VYHLLAGSILNDYRRDGSRHGFEKVATNIAITDTQALCQASAISYEVRDHWHSIPSNVLEKKRAASVVCEGREMARVHWLP
jgi:hypothetical protein